MEGFEYKKTTKYDVDFPAYCYFFIEKLMKYERCVIKPDDRLEIKISTSKYPYCYDAFVMVVKTMQRRGYATMIPGFSRQKIEGKDDMLHYKFTLKKLVNKDDLPF